MAYRFTNTDKWNDSWFSELKPIEKLLFIYLCDNCDIAGFIEINMKRWSADIDITKSQIEGALKGLERGLIYSELKDCIFIIKFIKHQKNLPINPNNQAHKGIISRFDNYSLKFNFEDYNNFIEGANKGLRSPIGNGNGNDPLFKGGVGEKTWRTDFQVYLKDCKEAFKNFENNQELMEKQKYFNPGLDVLKTMQKSYSEYWGQERGWKNKKATKTKIIDWEATIINAINNKMNKVYLPR
jgi:hypothetical protein